jgi:DNA-binding CsgD family transcriptional regulator
MRLRGDYTRAEETYVRASERGRQPQPGLALLRLAEGQVPAAVAAIRRAVDEAIDPRNRLQLLAAYVEVLLAADEVGAARAAADELAATAAELGAPALRATAGYATGTVLLAEGDARAALGMLRPAWVAWRDLDAPYEAARVRMAVGAACRRLGDEDGATLEFQAAARAFRELGAVTDLARLEQLAAPAPSPAGGLSNRERQVLELVATGMTNRAIATELVISEKTVARHVANIFTKLGLSSRAAATAYAYEHGLVGRIYTE